jgi:signal transduction histidine kinase
MRIAVIDSGPGVTTDEDVFEAIERVSRRSGAAGFRLAISRSIARLLGGDLVLERTGTPGATFALSLPLTQAGPEAGPGATGSDRTRHS